MDYLLVNIPEFRLHVYDKGSYSWSSNVVVGSTVNSTVIFTGNLKHVVFSPYWNVPSSILKKAYLLKKILRLNLKAILTKQFFGEKEPKI